ncbi:persistence regulator MprA [Labilithrix luteola]|uniref:Persistence regulator MprA n=1 Tax=Labilithrix luteola TaxID=1391654 RepID=A0A0K1Q4A0_9BACT|nr:persistence regulator MprA [Labilithrix luteola]
MLVIEDHDDVCELVGRSLAKDGHRVTTAKTLADADECVRSNDFDAAVLDLGMPDGDGLVWCKHLREGGHSFPILVLTAQSAVSTRVSGLDAGADDFVAKPFAVAELRARIRALGRRGPMQRRSEFSSGGIHLDFSARRAHVDGREVPLTSREWSIVDLLVSRAGRVVSRSDILEMVGGEATPAAEASLEVLVGRIRKKLGTTFIRTVRGEGYAAG